MADAGQQQRERRLWLALGASACFQALTMSLVVVLLMGGVRSPLPAADGTEPADLQGRRGGRQLLGAAVSATDTGAVLAVRTSAHARAPPRCPTRLHSAASRRLPPCHPQPPAKLPCGAAVVQQKPPARIPCLCVCVGAAMAGGERVCRV